jgi:glycine oxidase
LYALAHGRYPSLARSLLEETGIDIGYRLPGALRLEREVPKEVARGKIERAYRGAGYQARWVLGEELRELAPGIASDFAAALHLPEEAVVHPQELVRALAASCRQRGVVVREGVAPARFLPGDGPRIELASGEVVGGDACVVAAGAWSPGLCEELGPAYRLAVEPIRGQAIEVRCRWSHGPNLHFESARYGREYYIISRGSGLAWVGSTVEEAGFDASTTPEGVAELLLALREVFPESAAGDLVRAWAGLRPKALRRGGPFLGRLPGSRGIWVACGHYRSGILAGPVSAEILAKELLRGEAPAAADDPGYKLLEAFSP